VIEIVPVYETCGADVECTWLDPRLRCRPFLLSSQRRCAPPPGDSRSASWLVFPHPGEGQSVSGRFLLRSVGTIPLYISQIGLYSGPLHGIGAAAQEHVQRFRELRRPQMDVLFVIDNSPST